MLAMGGSATHVRVPNRLAAPKASDRLAVLQNVGDDVNFRHTLDEPASGLLYGSEVEFAESPTEGDQVGIGKILVTKQQDQVIEPRTTDDAECVLVQPAQIDAADFRAKSAARRDDQRYVASHLHLRAAQPLKVSLKSTVDCSLGRSPLHEKWMP
jgi:hypothetical protein